MCFVGVLHGGYGVFWGLVFRGRGRGSIQSPWL